MLGLKRNKPIGHSQRSHFTTITKTDFFLPSLFKFANNVVVETADFDAQNKTKNKNKS